MSTVTRAIAASCVLLLVAAVQAAQPPAALELVFHEAVRYQIMDSKSAAEHRKDPSRPLQPATDPDGKPKPIAVEPLHVFLDLGQSTGTVRQARAAQEPRQDKKVKGRPPMWNNYSVHPVDASAARWRDGRLAGSLSVTIEPGVCHLYQQVRASCRLQFEAAPGQDGRYSGRYGDHEVAGKVTCEAATPPDLARPCETTLMINNALNMPGIGPGAPRGCLNASWKDGKAETAHLADTYGYNLWLATVDTGGLVLRDGRLSGKLLGHVTSSYQSKYAGDCEWTIDAVVIGRRVLGTGTGKKTNSKAEEFDIAVNGLIANTSGIADVKQWWLDRDIRARAASDDEGYWKGRNPQKQGHGAGSAARRQAP